MTGMRSEELFTLHWNDVNFEKGFLTVNKTIYYKNVNNYSFNEPKTHASNRDIVLDSDTLKLLKEWKKNKPAL